MSDTQNTVKRTDLEAIDYVKPHHVAETPDTDGHIKATALDNDRFGNVKIGILTDGEMYAVAHRRDDCTVIDEESGNERKPSWSVRAAGTPTVTRVETHNDSGRDTMEAWFEAEPTLAAQHIVDNLVHSDAVTIESISTDGDDVEVELYQIATGERISTTIQFD